jgi:sugar lactone lactonase YvrE
MRELMCAVCGSLCLWSAAAGQDVLVSSRFSNSVLRYEAGTGDFVGVFASEEVLNPNGIAFGPDGSLYVGMGDLKRVGRYDGVTGDYLGDFVFDDPETDEDETGGMERVRGIHFGPDGNLYVSSAETDSVIRFDGKTGALMGTFAESVDLDGPIGMTFGPDGHLYVASALTNRVLRFDGETGAELGSLVTGILNPTGVITGEDDLIYVASAISDHVRKYTVDGEFQGLGASGNGLDIPIGIAFGPDGLLYVASFQTDSVLRFDGATGEFVNEFVGSGEGGLNGTHFFAFLPCKADANGDGALNVLDFVAFQQLFVAGEAGADCNGDGALNVLDFVAFQQAFVEGCEWG